MLDLTHIKQLLFIDPKIYQYFWQKDKNNINDILLALPHNAELPQRKNEFKEKLY